jgi:hypothetical protein
MPSKIVEYHDFIITVSYNRVAIGLVPTVVVRRTSGGPELRLPPPSPERGFKTENEAFGGGIAYAKAAIDGRVPRVDVEALIGPR